MATMSGAAYAAEDVNFRNRVFGGLIDAASTVLAEPTATAFHADRVAFAQKIVEFQTVRMEAAVKAIAMKEHVAIDVDQSDMGLTDAAIIASVNTHFNFLAGIATGA